MSSRAVLIFAAVLGMCICSPASAQKKSETKLYDKTVAAPSVKAFDKFLAKYPTSVYAAEIAARRDTLLNISPYSPSMALDILTPFLPEGSVAAAIGWRRDATDHVSGICFTDDTLGTATRREIMLTLENGTWTKSSEFSFDWNDGDTYEPSILGEPGILKLGKGEYLHVKLFLKSATCSMHVVEELLYDPREEMHYLLDFTGRDVKGGSTPAGYLLEGRSNEGIVGGMDRPQYIWLKNSLEADKGLVFISEGDYLTDYAVETWTGNNPDALNKACKLKFSILPPECSLVEIYCAGKKKNSASYGAAMFDYRGHTVVVSYDKKKDEYCLAWCEPECKDHWRDRLLNDIVFESSSQLELQYYHGQRFYKRHLNLKSKSVR